MYRVAKVPQQKEHFSDRPIYKLCVCPIHLSYVHLHTLNVWKGQPTMLESQEL